MAGDVYKRQINILTKGGSWASIVCKDWMIANGAWDGNPDTWPKWYDQMCIRDSYSLKHRW